MFKRVSKCIIDSLSQWWNVPENRKHYRTQNFCSSQKVCICASENPSPSHSYSLSVSIPVFSKYRGVRRLRINKGGSDAVVDVDHFRRRRKTIDFTINHRIFQKRARNFLGKIWQSKIKLSIQTVNLTNNFGREIFEIFTLKNVIFWPRFTNSNSFLKIFCLKISRRWFCIDGASTRRRVDENYRRRRREILTKKPRRRRRESTAHTSIQIYFRNFSRISS